jgi:hypothetical protein
MFDQSAISIRYLKNVSVAAASFQRDHISANGGIVKDSQGRLWLWPSKDEAGEHAGKSDGNRRSKIHCLILIVGYSFLFDRDE